MAKFRSHPICRIKKFVEIKTENPAIPVAQALEQAEAQCVAEGKLHGIIRLVEEAERLGWRPTKRAAVTIRA